MPSSRAPGPAPCLEGVLAPEERTWLAGREAVAKALGLGLDGFVVLPDPPRVFRAPAAHPGLWQL